MSNEIVPSYLSPAERTSRLTEALYKLRGTMSAPNTDGFIIRVRSGWQFFRNAAVCSYPYTHARV